jgi:acetyl esterase/lipase
MNIEDYRRLTTKGDTERNSHLVMNKNVKVFKDLVYSPSKNLALDLYLPLNASKPSPLLIMIHGGGWVYGNKEINAYYASEVAAHGFALACLNYSLAPEHPFPEAIYDVGEAINFLKETDVKQYYDFDSMSFLADSAGVNIACTYIYALEKKKDLFPNLKGFLPKACLLNCGAYFNVLELKTDMISMVYQAYLGSIKEDDPRLFQKEDITSDFPLSFIVTSNGDFLNQSSLAFINVLKERQATYKFVFASDSETSLPHDFQLNFVLTPSQRIMDGELSWLKDVLKNI